MEKIEAANRLRSSVIKQDSTIKILGLASYTFLPAKVGGQKGIALFYKYLSRYIPVHCVTTRSNDPSCASGYTVENILSPSVIRYANPFYFFLLRNIIRREAASHVMIEHPYYGWLAVLLKWFCGIKLIVHSHNIESLRFKTMGKSWWRILWYYEKFVHRQANYSFFVTDEDRLYAINQYGIQPGRCITAAYGIENNTVPAENERKKARTQLEQLYPISPDTSILFFNGTFDYSPNREGLYYIMDEIIPLLNKSGISYEIMICGRDIPEELIQRKIPHVHFAGFVDDISVYFKGADIFLNPISSGGGIKTKLVEALASDLYAVSTVTGAIGVPADICGGKMQEVADGDWNAFADAVVNISSQPHTTISSLFFDRFYWDHITERAARFIASR